MIFLGPCHAMPSDATTHRNAALLCALIHIVCILCVETTEALRNIGVCPKRGITYKNNRFRFTFAAPSRPPGSGFIGECEAEIKRRLRKDLVCMHI